MSLTGLQIRHVRAFTAVAREQSFAKAAKALCVSQPALSQTINQFEQMLGFAVFERTTRRVNLTANGQILLERSIVFNEALDSFQSDIENLMQEVSNTLSVGYLIGTALELIPDIVREFEKVRPSAEIDLIEFDFNTPDAGLSDGLVDCAIVRPPIGVADLTLVDLARERCVACLPVDHRLAAEKTVRIADLLNEPFIAAPSPGAWRDYWLAGDYRNGTPPDVVLEVATVDAELQAIAARKGISITAESTAKYYARPGVEFRPIVDMDLCRIAIAHRGSANRLVRDFISIARKVAGQGVVSS